MGLVLLAAGNWFFEIWNWLWLLICQGIYVFVGFLYQVFEKVASINLFSSDIFDKITGRLYVVIGIAMLFVFAYNIILNIINPDGKGEKAGNLAKSVKNTIISLIVVVLLPTVFNYMYILQTDILESNIIGTIILGGAGSTSGDSTNCEEGDYDCTCDFTGYGLDNYTNRKSFLFIEWNEGSDMESVMSSHCNNYKNNKTAAQRGAYSIAPTVFSAFYRPTNFTFEDCANYLSTGSSSVITGDEDKKICVNYFTDIVLSKYTGDIGPFVKDSYLKDIVSDSNKDSMQFDWIMAVIAGILAVYMFFCYTMEIGVRVAKLGFLQIISPIPVMLRIIPGKDGMMGTWSKQLINTYVDVFIRLAIIYFALFSISLVPDVVSTLFKSMGELSLFNFVIQGFTLAFVILGILKFAQDAPGLLKEYFGSSGSFSLKSPKKQLQENKIAKGLIGAGGASGAVLGKNLWDSGKNIFNGAKEDGFRGAAKQAGKNLLNVPRGISQQYGAAVNGFKYGKEANDMDKMRDYVYGAASEQMTKSSLKDKIKDYGDKESRAFKNFYKAEYSAFNSPVALKTANDLDRVSKSLETLEKLLDSTDPVKAVEQQYKYLKDALPDPSKQFNPWTYMTKDEEGNDREITVTRDYLNANPSKLNEVMEALEKNYKADKGKARGRGYALKKDDEDFKAAIMEYRDAVTKNLDAVNVALEANGKNKITNVSVELNDEHVINNYKEVRDAGDSAKQHANLLRTQATKQQELGKDNK